MSQLESGSHYQTFLRSSESILMHYDEAKTLILICDASPFGISAILSHPVSEGREAPIAFYSRTLSLAERNYMQIDKEVLAIIAEVKKFHDDLYGQQFTIMMEHKPLLGLFAPD